MLILSNFMESGQVLLGNEIILNYLDNLNLKEIFGVLKPVFTHSNIRFKDFILHRCNFLDVSYFKYQERFFILGPTMSLPKIKPATSSIKTHILSLEHAVSSTNNRTAHFALLVF